MPLITAHLSISLDGFVAGPEQSEQNPIGVGGMALHTWHLGEPTSDADRRMSDRVMAPRGAYVMGRNMFGPGARRLGTPPTGAAGGVTSRRTTRRSSCSPITRDEPIPMAGGTTFYFVDDFDSAVEQAVAAAGDETVTIAGGASAVRQGLQRGLVDEMLLSHVPDRARWRRAALRRRPPAARRAHRGGGVTAGDPRRLPDRTVTGRPHDAGNLLECSPLTLLPHRLDGTPQLSRASSWARWLSSASSRRTWSLW